MATIATSTISRRVVIAESYERIHRSNLVGMGILPLQFGAGDNVESLGLTGEEVYSIEPPPSTPVHGHRPDRNAAGDPLL